MLKISRHTVTAASITVGVLHRTVADLSITVGVSYRTVAGSSITVRVLYRTVAGLSITVGVSYRTVADSSITVRVLYRTVVASSTTVGVLKTQIPVQLVKEQRLTLFRAFRPTAPIISLPCELPRNDRTDPSGSARHENMPSGECTGGFDHCASSGIFAGKSIPMPYFPELHQDESSPFPLYLSEPPRSSIIPVEPKSRRQLP